MCGIAGYFSPNDAVAPAAGRTILESMAHILESRGPDFGNVAQFGQAGFAHRRLAVIDISPEANQPMTTPDGRFAITYNGELYNYKALRHELSGAGYAFATQSDTEVVLAAYVMWGENFVDRLRGMFALAIYDLREARLCLVRDPAGEKPLYYSKTASGLVFASEIKAMLLWPEIERSPSLRAVHSFLSYQYVPGPDTAFEAIFQLEPGTLLTVQTDGNIATRRYWEPALCSRAEYDRRPHSEIAEDLFDRLSSAVAAQMVSDVPVGILLSGGIDSSAIVGVLANAGISPINTYTISFHDLSIDERSLARQVSDRFETNHTEFIVSDGIEDATLAVATRLDQPLADPACLPLYLLTEVMRRSVTVALSGDGGDEALLGYARYMGVKASALFDRLPLPLQRFFGRIGGTLPFENSPVRLLRYIRRLLIEIGKSAGQRYADWITVFDDGRRYNLFSDADIAAVGTDSVCVVSAALNSDEHAELLAALFDFRRYLPYDLMMKTDMMSMSHGLEVRCPYLDRDLIDFCACIPPALRMHSLDTKWILRSALDPYLPTSVLSAPKTGLSVPMLQWLQEDLRNILDDCMSTGSVTSRGLFLPSVVEMMMQDLRRGSSSYQYKLWSLMWLELWFRNYIDRGPEAEYTLPASVTG